MDLEKEPQGYNEADISPTLKEKYIAYNALLDELRQLTCRVLTVSIIFLSVGLGYFIGETVNLVTSPNIPLVNLIGVAISKSGNLDAHYKPEGALVTFTIIISVVVQLLFLTLGMMGIYTRQVARIKSYICLQKLALYGTIGAVFLLAA